MTNLEKLYQKANRFSEEKSGAGCDANCFLESNSRPKCTCSQAEGPVMHFRIESPNFEGKSCADSVALSQLTQFAIHAIP
jgi:hypothetical protein